MRLSVFVLAGLIALPCQAQPVQYDWHKANTNRRAELAEAKTDLCMEDAAKAMLQQGARDRKSINRFMIGTCRKLIDITMAGQPRADIEKKLAAMATDELNYVLSEGQ